MGWKLRVRNDGGVERTGIDDRKNLCVWDICEGNSIRVCVIYIQEEGDRCKAGGLQI